MRLLRILVPSETARVPESLARTADRPRSVTAPRHVANAEARRGRGRTPSDLMNGDRLEPVRRRGRRTGTARADQGPK